MSNKDNYYQQNQEYAEIGPSPVYYSNPDKPRQQYPGPRPIQDSKSYENLPNPDPVYRVLEPEYDSVEEGTMTFPNSNIYDKVAMEIQPALPLDPTVEYAQVDKSKKR